MAEETANGLRRINAMTPEALQLWFTRVVLMLERLV